MLDRIEPLARAGRGRHALRPDHARGLQQPVHVDRRADGRDAAEHRLLGQHQGAARLLLRGVRRRRRAGRQRPAHAGASGLDGRVRAHDPASCAATRMRPGDVCALNNPYNGGTHLPDITVVMPVFDGDGELLFFTAARGTTPTSAASRRARCRPTARTIDEEGVLFDNFQLVESGRLREAELLRGARARARTRRATPTRTSPTCRRRSPPAQRGANELAQDGGAVRPRHGPRLHGPRPGQRRGERAARARRAAGRRVRPTPHRRRRRWSRCGSRSTGRRGARRSTSPAPARSSPATSTRRPR